MASVSGTKDRESNLISDSLALVSAKLMLLNPGWSRAFNQCCKISFLQ